MRTRRLRRGGLFDRQIAEYDIADPADFAEWTRTMKFGAELLEHNLKVMRALGVSVLQEAYERLPDPDGIKAKRKQIERTFGHTVSDWELARSIAEGAIRSDPEDELAGAALLGAELLGELKQLQGHQRHGRNDEAILAAIQAAQRFIELRATGLYGGSVKRYANSANAPRRTAQKRKAEACQLALSRAEEWANSPRRRSQLSALSLAARVKKYLKLAHPGPTDRDRGRLRKMLKDGLIK